MIHIWVDIVYFLYSIVCIIATGAYLYVFCFFCIYTVSGEKTAPLNKML